MTPFGARIRDLRRQRGITLQQMAADLNVSAAYLSALEHGKRGKPGPGLVLELCGYFGLIWDEAEALKNLAEVSRPKVTLDTSGLSPQATAFANRLGACIRYLDDEAVATLDALLVRIQPPLPAKRSRRS
ncbi:MULTISPECIES: helix-turn-helix domain-containing protein [unclassified Haematospirillum]|uniref:helix-turn-helix domain-containing protein n=1 Tax=unclassified Haematospirillum TaxID=2622088 RepID=UPI00143998AA|nr:MULTISPECIES: helix-turn-helix transcriptional regulator [unclassified Haematospirillum]NKD55570.1 helix-turn-helix transcriptional regulator [Haematospirillum sp. H4890]NKD75709.1 helix-turn-helix transcriptional regulator [Haematospirillum sp. H4485]NKD88299.1 helix-turn-helix transcriptional regulator [Haematospirillum sp. 15-248]